MKEKIRWGILGPGRIARAFAEGLKYVQNGELVAIASRNQVRADEFAREWKVEHSYGSYQELAESTTVDAVYIATPHSEHRRATSLCLKNGKCVLCEKPLAVNAKEVRAMIETAQNENLLLMEGMWSRFPPLMAQVRQWVQEEIIGKVSLIQADFGFLPKDTNPDGRLFNPNLAGGSILDVGIYPISFASMLMGCPKEFLTFATMSETGVDKQASCLLRYNCGAHAMLHSSISYETGQEAQIFGSKGSIRIHKQCWRPQKATIKLHKNSEEKIVEMPFVGNGFNYEAEHFGNLIITDKKDSDIMPLKESLGIITLLDKIREDWNLKYPFED